MCTCRNSLVYWGRKGDSSQAVTMPSFAKMLFIHRCQNCWEDEDGGILLRTQQAAFRCSSWGRLHVGQVSELPLESAEPKGFIRSLQGSQPQVFHWPAPLAALCPHRLQPQGCSPAAIKVPQGTSLASGCSSREQRAPVIPVPNLATQTAGGTSVQLSPECLYPYGTCEKTEAQKAGEICSRSNPFAKHL